MERVFNCRRDHVVSGALGFECGVTLWAHFSE